MRRSQHMHIKYMFIVQRYGLMPAAAGGVLHRECGLTSHRLGAAIRRSGRQSPRRIRSSRTLRQASLLPAHGLDREQHLLTIRTPRATSSEIAIALWSSRTSSVSGPRNL